MDRWRDRVAVVTGASSGIGAATVKDLVHAGMIVVGLARRKERVDEMRTSLPAAQRDRLHSVRCDVSDPKSVAEAFDWIERTLGGVDVLVNNAGTNAEGQLLTQDIGQLQGVLQTNVMGTVYCCQRAFKSMKQRAVDGHLVLVNSVLGHNIFDMASEQPPIFNIYPATKHAITAMTETLRQELRDLGTNVKVTSISPGLVDTEIVPEGFRDLTMLHAEDISSGIMYVLSTPPHVQVYELTIKPLGEKF